ncbi:MAG TPA: lipid-A-disaccharide synthase [Xanthobacteraceae bacterium]|nr:lipid-A-disaccharide synthase [Xanthobacteraceae bacterium]
MSEEAPQRAGAPLKVFIIAGEESGDRLAGALIEALRQRAPVPIAFQGVGGRAMAAQGVASLFPTDHLAIVGFASIPRQLPAILRDIRAAAECVVTVRPDVLVIVDSPDFTHRVARRVRAAAPAIPIVDYVSPSVWAWRPGRARAMRAYVDHVLALLPFEPDAHARLGGPPCTFVGHPLAEEIALLRPNAEEAQRRAADPPVVLVLPGSRSSEIARHLSVFGEAAARVADRQTATGGALDLVLPTVPHLAERVRRETAGWRIPPRIVVDATDKWAAFRTARAALAASGTVTLELALAGVPTVVSYRVALLNELIYRAVVRVPTIVLANLVLNENVMPQITQREATPEALAAALMPLIDDTPERRKQLAALARIDDAMKIGSTRPSEAAAQVVLEVARRGRV